MNKISIYSTMTRKVAELVPMVAGKVKFFVCGPTVYDLSHLGHAKTYTQFDFIVKYLRWSGFDVNYLQNITDLDDKIIKRAAEKNISWKDLTQDFEKKYIEDMQALGNNAVSKFARATDYIENIVDQTQRMLDKGLAYRTPDGSIYFEIAKFGDYGKLSGRTELKEDDSVSRIDADDQKKGWNDFCLWKVSKEGEPSWDTALGKGRPGWHIEDTAITEVEFGPHYDIHGGAIDLIFPHHEAEITQMESIAGAPLVRYWMHTGFLNINSVKMSKSLGNFKTIRDLLKAYDHRVLRYFFISNHYRAAMDFNDAALEQAKNSLGRIDEFIFNKVDANFDDDADEAIVETAKAKFHEALANDFNTPQAFAVLFEFIRGQNMKEKSGRRTFEFLRQIDSFVGFMKFDAAKTDAFIESLIADRNVARAAKDFAKSDLIRDRLLSMGVKIYDAKEGTKYRI
ncbi:MAG: cysteine--tRNA ligase [Candidatus Paceibacterota bacterium]